MSASSDLASKFPHVKMPVENNLLLTCMSIARLRSFMQADAAAHNGYVRDQKGQITGLNTARYAAQIKEITALFNNIPHSTTMYRYSHVMARDVATRLKKKPDVAALHQDWQSLPPPEQMKGLRLLSDTMIDVMNETDGSLLFNTPVLGLSNIPRTSTTMVAMQVQKYDPRQRTSAPDLTLITVNREILSGMSFNLIAAMLWHEHQHIYMTGLREAYANKDIKREHPLFEDACRSHTIDQYKITGNIQLSQALYYAEPEEKLCYFTQDIFEKAFGAMAEKPALKMA